MKTKLLALVMIVSMAAAGWVQYRYDTHRGYFSEREVFLALPSGKTLRILSFGFRNLAADLLFIWAIQFYSTYNLTNSYDYLEHIFNVITDISPKYKEPYIVGSWIMALEAKDVDMAFRLLQKGASNLPDEYIFDYESGFYAYKNLKDYALAEKYFARAAAKPTAPSLVARRYAHLVYMKDDLNYAWELWMDIYKKSTDLLERNAAQNHLHQIKFEMDKKWLEQEIARFKQKYHRLPYNLNELKSTGLVRSIPKSFDGTDYIYLPGKGTITVERVLQWKKSS